MDRHIQSMHERDSRDNKSQNRYQLHVLRQRTDAYGLSRSRDKRGVVVKRELKPYTMCLHTSAGGGRENMWILVVEIYEDTDLRDERQK